MANTIMEVTLSAAKMTYQIESMRLLNHNPTFIRNYLETAKLLGNFPKELSYSSSFYDKKTGSSGTLFKNEKLENYILAYTGTNSYTDAQKDIETDIYSIGLGQGLHYRSCFNFYKRVVKKYGENIILTGHSLGGNIAQRVALEFNVKNTVIYNAAPLYIKNGVDLFMDVTEENRQLYTKRLRRYNKNVHEINSKLECFTGNIIHFSSENDILNRMMRVLGNDSFYVGKDYILKDGGMHGFKSLFLKNDILLSVLTKGKYDKTAFSKRHQPLTYEEKHGITNLASNREMSIDYFTALFLGNETIVNLIANRFNDINITKFMNYLIKKIEEQGNN